MIKSFAGVGSRKVPPEVYNQLRDLGKMMAEHGIILRSGGATGADMAFEDGCNLVHGQKEIYLPWKGFNRNASPHYTEVPGMEELAITYHPGYNTLSQPIKKLMKRNGQQVLGQFLNDPTDLIICWTPDGKEHDTTKDTGGTGQAIRIANGHDIPVFNMQNLLSHDLLMEFIDEKILTRSTINHKPPS